MTYAIVNADNRYVLAAMPENSVDAIVTDPPYGMSSAPDMIEVLRHWLAGDDYTHTGGGFMGKTWDSFVPGPVTWRHVLRVLKPGGHLLASYAPRTYDLGVLAIRLAGFEIRDQLAWMYGTGFPKSKDVARAVDMELCMLPGRHYDENLPPECPPGKTPTKKHRRPGDHLCPAHPDREPWSGWGTALKPAHEPIVLARKPLIGTVAANVLAHGTGGINVDACRIAPSDPEAYAAKGASVVGLDSNCNGAAYGEWAGKREDSTSPIGRWPANVLLDEEAAAMLDAQSGACSVNRPATYKTKTGEGLFGLGDHEPGHVRGGFGDTGGASRFLYTAKASKAEREAGLDHLPVRSGGELTDRVDGSDGLNSPRAGAGRGGGRRNHHPTVKPLALMRYLVRLITPPGGIVLDPFCGSGSTIAAAVLEQFNAIGIDLDPEYCNIARARVAHWETKT